jgi:5-methylcytosine-specific restriction protein A
MRWCAEPHCSALIPDGDGDYCATHARPEPRQVAARMHGRAWLALRSRILRRDRRVCYLCRRPCATEVDHVVALSEGGTNDPANLAAVCGACHARKSAAEAARGRARAAKRRRLDQ